MLGPERMRKTISRHGATALACVLAISVANEKVAHAEKTQRPEKKKTTLPRTDPRARARPKTSELVLALPSGAAYSVDDGPSQLADTRTRVLVDPGEHRVHVMSGSRDVVVDVSIEQGASAVVRMPPAEASPPLVLASVMDAGVTDPAYGPPPLATYTSPADAAPPGGIAPSTATSVPPPPRIEISPSLAPTTSFSPTRVDVVSHGKAPVVISLVGAAASLAALGTGFALASGGASSDATSLRAESLDAGRYCAGANGGGRCAEAVEADRRADDLRSAAIGVFAGAVAFASSALVVHFAWPKSTQSLTVTGSASPQGGAAAATFRF